MKAKTASPSKKKPAPAANKKAAAKSGKKAASTSRKKTASVSKKKPVSVVNKNAVAQSKKKAVSKAKKKAASPSKRKPVSTAKEKHELSNQVMELMETAFKGKRIAYFVLDTERTKDGAFIVCVAAEGEAGFYKMGWGWHCSYTKAKAETALMNKKLGLNEEEVNEIIISTMGPPSYK